MLSAAMALASNPVAARIRTFMNLEPPIHGPSGQGNDPRTSTPGVFVQDKAGKSRMYLGVWKS